MEVERVTGSKPLINGFNPMWISKNIKLSKIKEVWKQLTKKHSGKR